MSHTIYLYNGNLWKCEHYHSKLKQSFIGIGYSKEQAKRICEEKISYFQCRNTVNEVLKSNVLLSDSTSSVSMRNASFQSTVLKDNIRENNNISQKLLIDEKVNENISDSDLDSEYEVSKKELDRVVACFKFPRNVLNNVSQKVKNHTQLDMLRQPIYKLTQDNVWSCIHFVNWPEGMKFIGYGRSKQEAANDCSIKVLHFLLKTDKLNTKGEPNFYSKAEKQNLLRPAAVNITLNDTFISEVRSINKYYNDNIIPALQVVQEEENERNIRIQNGLEPDINLEKWNLDRNDIPYHRIQKRNEVLRWRIGSLNNNRHKAVRESFPIYKYREEFLQLLADNKVVVVKGEPGCGKSTQIPQYIIEQASSNGNGADCNIIITQPRRISAISLAHRIADERGEQVGDVVGFHIRLKNVQPDKSGGNILFCSTGIALRRIQSDPELQQCSHIIIDEAHERDADTDTLLLLVKRALELNPDLKVIVMSATINAELFQTYFNGCAALHVPGFTYPVKMHFLDEAVHLNLKKSSRDSDKDIPRIHEDEIAEVIRWIDKNKGEGAILCFLPGWAEIGKVQKHLEELRCSSMMILQAHSKLSTDEQRKIFNRPPRNMRKVILSTNICETSLTIDDVVYVVDSGMHKDRDILPSGLQSIACEWISQASVNQRKGRAGRVRPGESFHLFTKHRYQNMHRYPVPEILRVPLAKIILDSKTYSRGEYATEYLSQMIEPPPQQRIDQAVEELVEMSALDENEELTPLGRRIALFSLPPKLSKALVHSAIFKCVNPLLTISTIYATEIELFSRTRSSKQDSRNIKLKFSKLSDHIAMTHVYDCWESNTKSSYELKVNNDRMDQIRKLREINASNLYSCGILESTDYYEDRDASCNENSRNQEVVKAILMSGVDTVLQHYSHSVVRGSVRKSSSLKNEFGQIVKLTSESVLNSVKDFPSPFMCYISEVHSVERKASVVHEASVLSPLSVLLFSDTAVESVLDATAHNNKYKTITLFGKRVQFSCDSEQVDDILELRTVIWNVFQYFIARQGKEENKEIWHLMTNYRDGLIDFVGRLLNHVKPGK